MKDLLDLNVYEIDKNYYGNDLFICREDLIPFSFGGNKARKGYHFLKEILKEEPDCVVTYGSSSSNHCRIIANICAKYGFKCIIISPEEQYKETFNLEFIKFFDAQIISVPVNDVSETIDITIKEMEREGLKTYFIPGGGHGDIGTFAYVDFFRRLNHIEQKERINFDYIFFASGTGTTQAGLIIGNAIYGQKSSIVGISIARNYDYGKQVILDSIWEYIRNKRLDIEVKGNECIFIDDYINGGYGKTNDEVYDVINDCLKKYGIPMDTTYTAKAFYGMKQYVKRNMIKDTNILFIHTGGVPLFFDYLVDIQGDAE